jgi:hypothetical protein
VVSEEGILKGCAGEEFYGYEIHMGTTDFGSEKVNPFLIENRFGKEADVIDGVINSKGKVMGTYIHGIFDADSLRRKILNNLRAEKGWEPVRETTVNFNLEKEKAFNELADVVRNSFDMEKVYKNYGAEMNYLIISIGYILDLIFSEPKRMPHPVVLIGNIISFLEKKLYREDQSDSFKFWKGSLLNIIVLAVVFGIVYFIVKNSNAYSSLCLFNDFWNFSFIYYINRSFKKSSNGYL